MDWMTQLPERLHSCPLTKLAIPGSHNSGTFALDSEGDYAPDAPPAVRMGAGMPGLGQGLKSICHKWSMCQKLTFREQLEAGVRYFDLRVSTRPSSEDFYFVHTLYGPKVNSLAEALIQFLSENSKEIVILDFNHFYAMDTTHHVLLVQILLSQFSEKLCPHCEDINSVTLRSLWDQGKQVIIYYRHEISESMPELWPSQSMIAPWPNTDNENKCLQYLSDAFAKEHEDKFVVCQGILTPDYGNLLKMVCGTLESTMEPFTPLICSWVAETPQTCKHPLNIVMTDFVEKGDFIQKVLDLNATRLS